jgi:hypothetical protein
MEETSITVNATVAACKHCGQILIEDADCDCAGACAERHKEKATESAICKLRQSLKAKEDQIQQWESLFREACRLLLEYKIEEIKVGLDGRNGIAIKRGSKSDLELCRDYRQKEKWTI